MIPGMIRRVDAQNRQINQIDQIDKKQKPKTDKEKILF